MNRALFVCFSVLIIQIGSITSESQIRRGASDAQRVERAESHPDLAATINDVSQLKIAARKTKYRVGEMVTLDIALLNTSSRQLFFRTLSEIQIKVRNSAGQPITIQAYGAADRALVPSSFVSLPASEMILRSFQLLVGCDKRAFAQYTAPEQDNVTLFNRGLFLSWGDACLPIEHRETLTVSAEIKNAFVLTSPARARTAVGAINSNSLELRIDESK